MSTSKEGKTILCRAAVMWEAKKPLSIETVEVAPPKAGEVRIKIVATGVCHTDATMMNGYTTSAIPCILGHEGAGIVESIGEGVTTVKPGDHVIPSSMAQCKECEYCKNPNTNLCSTFDPIDGRGVMLDGTTRFTCKGKTIHHFMGLSTFSEYTVVLEMCVAKIDPNAPLDKVCLLGCGVSTGYGAALNSGNVQPGQQVAIWGLGGVGLAVAMGCRVRGAKKIIGIDLNPAKFELAKKFGCTEFVNPKEIGEKPIQDVLKEMTGGSGLDCAFECIGNVSTMKAALESCNKGWGVAVIIGAPSAGKELSINPYDIIMGRCLRGSAFGGWKGRDSIPSLVQDYLQGKIMLDEFITHDFNLDKLNDAFDILNKGEALRSVIHF